MKKKKKKKKEEKKERENQSMPGHMGDDQVTVSEFRVEKRKKKEKTRASRR